MFFLISNITIGKCYPSFMVQFITGIIFYVVTLLVLQEIVGYSVLVEYKAHICSLLVIDLAYLIYVVKFCIHDNITLSPEEKSVQIKSIDRNHDLSENSDEFKITHETSDSIDDLMFSLSESKITESELSEDSSTARLSSEKK